jgi:amino acid transporter
MTVMVSNDDFVKSYRTSLPNDLQKEYDNIVSERRKIYFTGYLIGFIVSIFIIIINVRALKTKMPVMAMVCLVVVVSTVVNYFYYMLSPKSNHMVSLLTTDKQREDWLRVYKSMQYYYHSSFVLGAIAVGVFAYAFRGSC